MTGIEAMAAVQKKYYDITGLRGYFVQDENEINGAKEKNFFCKCLKTSASALRQCEQCTMENYAQGLRADEVQMYSCHAGIVKWAVPIHMKDVEGVFVSEGVITQKQMEDSESWINYLSEKYNVSRSILLENYHEIRKMTEPEVQNCIDLIKVLIKYYATLVD